MNEDEARESRRRAVEKYQSKFERINCRLPMGTRERIEGAGYNSANAFIVAAIMEKLEKEEKYFGKTEKNT